MTHIVLLAHGSTDPRSSNGAQRLREQVSHCLPDDLITLAYLDHVSPSLAEAVSAAGVHDVLVVPLFLSNAYHLRVDVPAAIAEVPADYSVHTSEALGLDQRFVDALDAQLPDDVNVVLASAGTSDVTAQEALRALAQQWSTRRGTDVIAAFAAQAEPDIATALDSLEEPRAIALLLLFDGVLPDRIRAAAGDAVITTPLVDSQALLEVTLERISAAR